jgi:hypothetical protein
LVTAQLKKHLAKRRLNMTVIVEEETKRLLASWSAPGTTKRVWLSILRGGCCAAVAVRQARSASQFSAPRGFFVPREFGQLSLGK